jgi:hypothetical protein
LAIDGFAGVTAIDCSVAAVTVSKVEPLMDDDVAVIVEVPTPAPVARPAALIVAVVVVPDDHVTVLVRFCVLPSLNVPVAVNCCVAPLVIDGFAGVTAIDCSVAAVTVRVVEPLIAPDVALIVEVPTPAPLARPDALIVAVVVVPELHVTVLVRFCVVPSLKVPVAVNCCVAPLAIEGFAGVTAIDCNVAAVTVSKVEPLIGEDVAVIVEVPTPAPVARPAALIVAVVVVPDDQLTFDVRLCVEPSLNVPVAVNCCVAPLAIDGFAGVTAIDCSVAAVTVSKVEPEIDDDVAVIVELPTPAPLARPAALIVATVVVPEVQVTVDVKFCVVPSLNVPVAVNCWVAPLAIDGFAGVTAIDCSVAAVTVRTVEPLIPPDVALIVEVPTPAPVARPPVLIVAVAVVPELQVTVLVRFCVVPSLKVPVAVNCCVAPLAIEGFAGVTAIDCSVAAVTVSKVEPLIEDDVALIVEVPTPAPLASPEALIVAVVVVPEVQVTVDVRFCVVPSLNVPVAVNCWVAPLAIEGFAGVTAIDCNVAAVTVSKVEPEIDDDVAVIVELPTPAPLARPAALIVAIEVMPEVQVTVDVRFCVVPSLNVPVAVNCCVAPLAIDGFAGVTAIDCSVAAVTVSKVEPEIDDDVAVIVEVPTPAPLARPAVLIVATVVVPEFQVTVDVKFCVVPSLNVPVAVNCWVAPLAIDGFAGVTAIDCSVAAVTVSKVEPLIAPDVALIVEVPTPAPVARPVALIVAVAVVPELHVTVLVRFCVVPSLKVPVAVNCCVAPLAIDGFAGVTAIDCNVAAVTVSKVEPEIDDDVAVMVEVPTPAPVARPAALIVAVVVVPEDQVTLDVRFCVEPSLNVPVAVNCCVAPLAIDGFAGVTAIDCNVAAVTVSKVEPLIDDDVAVMVEVPIAAAFARPVALIVAVEVVPEDQVTVDVRFCVVPSLKVPVAVNC